MAEAVAKETGVTVPYQVGTMIELPRAALRAGEIAESAEFFSFGTNDLTQTTLGVSRDDAASFLGTYTVKGLLEADPFVTLDTEGVGELITIAASAAGRRAPTSSSASAANTAATRPRSPSAKRRISTMSPARPSASRSPASPPRRRRWAGRRQARREVLLSQTMIALPRRLVLVCTLASSTNATAETIADRFPGAAWERV